MSLSIVNRLSQRTYAFYYEYGIAFLASILVFRKPATIAILLFVLINLVFYKHLNFGRKKWIPIVIIAIPLLLDLLFLWNNDSLYEGIKNGEKHLSMLFFPLLIIGQSFVVSLRKVLRIYTILFTLILVFCFIYHVAVSFEQFEKYLNGVEVWRMGYQFALSMDLHAPALNMHIAYLVVCSFYLLLTEFLDKKRLKSLSYQFLLFLTALFLLLIVNTRLAVVNALLGLVLISFWELFKKASPKKLIAIALTTFGIIAIFLFSFIKTFPYVIEKYTDVTFAHMDKVGKLDEIENPEAEVYSSLVTRVSIWKTTWDEALKRPLHGVGAADSRKVLTQAYIDTDQQFLAKYKFPIHNQYLDFLLKFGILGFIGVLLYIFHILWLGWKQKHSIVLFFFILFLTSNLTDDFLVRFDGITFSAFWGSVFAAMYWNNRPYKRDQAVQNFSDS